jgi:hypothetical protein
MGVKLFFFSLSLIAFQSYCMIKEKDEVKLMIKNEVEIGVYIEILQKYKKIAIDDTTTVAQVKSKLSLDEGISLPQLSLHTLISSFLFLKKKGDKLPDNQNIKQVMKDKNIDSFYLSVSAYPGCDK